MPLVYRFSTDTPGQGPWSTTMLVDYEPDYRHDVGAMREDWNNAAPRYGH